MQSFRIWTVPLMLSMTALTACGSIPQIATTTAAGLQLAKAGVELYAGQNPVTSGIDTKRIACRGFPDRITYSAKGDTPATVAQVRRYNARREALKCPDS